MPSRYVPPEATQDYHSSHQLLSYISHISHSSRESWKKRESLFWLEYSSRTDYVKFQMATSPPNPEKATQTTPATSHEFPSLPAWAFLRRGLRFRLFRRCLRLRLLLGRLFLPPFFFFPVLLLLWPPLLLFIALLYVLPILLVLRSPFLSMLSRLLLPLHRSLKLVLRFFAVVATIVFGLASCVFASLSS